VQKQFSFVFLRSTSNIPHQSSSTFDFFVEVFAFGAVHRSSAVDGSRRIKKIIDYTFNHEL
jgi:hypothetical protein